MDLEARRISLVGKGRKPRVIPIPRLLADELAEYLDDLRPTLPASPFVFANPINRTPTGSYGPYAIRNLVRRAGAKAGVSGRHFAHRRRHTYVISPALAA